MDVLWPSNRANQNLGVCAIFALSTLIAIFSKCSLLFHSLFMVVVVMELKVVGLVVVVVVVIAGGGGVGCGCECVGKVYMVQ